MQVSCAMPFLCRLCDCVYFAEENASDLWKISILWRISSSIHEHPVLFEVVFNSIWKGNKQAAYNTLLYIMHTLVQFPLKGFYAFGNQIGTHLYKKLNHNDSFQNVVKVWYEDTWYGSDSWYIVELLQTIINILTFSIINTLLLYGIIRNINVEKYNF